MAASSMLEIHSLSNVFYSDTDYKLGIRQILFLNVWEDFGLQNRDLAFVLHI